MHKKQELMDWGEASAEATANIPEVGAVSPNRLLLALL